MINGKNLLITNFLKQKGKQKSEIDSSATFMREGREGKEKQMPDWGPINDSKSGTYLRTYILAFSYSMDFQFSWKSN